MTAVVPVLTRWGVGADADLVYRALVQLRPRDVAGLARELGMSARRVGDAVDELVAIGAVAPGAGLLRATAVDQVVDRLRRPPGGRTRDDSRDRWRRHVAAVDGLGPLAVATARRWTLGAARARVTQLAEAERHEHLAINTEVVFSNSSLAAARPLDQRLLDRGVRALVVQRPPRDGDRGIPAHSVATVPVGSCRQTDDVPLKLIVFDRRVALFPADPLDRDQGYVEVADPDAVQRCCALFHRLWSRGRDPFAEGVAPIDLSRRERTLVVLLAAGHTDVTAAAELGISPRNVSYTMRAVMDRAGVENRFQLGLLLGATGTIRPPHDNEE
ncbi:LuxR C-terminal-related transcriptional regulator [Actinoplanes sp. NPDC051494]|uniref:helix-turn-helix transcriptional regulator n=1 Tax=Actinoplanes sp. NPDC051494 TaxID=3363907 RepID=UPI0037B7CA41